MSKRRGARYEIPAGVDAVHCRGCNAPIYWVLTSEGRPVPVNPDGTPHRATCPQAKEGGK